MRAPHGMTVRIHMTQRSDGADIARCGKHVATSRVGAHMKLARALVAAGMPDLPWETRRGTVRCLSGPSLHQLATRSMSEATGTPREIRWAPYQKEDAA